MFEYPVSEFSRVYEGNLEKEIPLTYILNLQMCRHEVTSVRFSSPQNPMLKVLQISISLPKMTRLARCENYSKPLSAPKLDSEKPGKERTSLPPEPTTIRSPQ